MRRSLGMVAALALAFPTPALADEPIGTLQPDPSAEHAQMAFSSSVSQPGDRFSVNVVLGFVQSWTHANVRRESFAGPQGAASGAPIAATENVAQYTASSSSLLVGADVALESAVTLEVRVPITLSFAQSLGDLDGSSATPIVDPSGAPLFSVPFESPTRSGVGAISAGLAWAITDERRDRTKPTWVIGVEGRLGVGTPLHACAQNSCPDPGRPSETRTPGISRGTDALVGKSVWSRRFGYLEPYTGVWLQAEFPQSSSDFRRYAPSEAEDPPVVTSFGAGLDVIPYEDREQQERLSADVLVRGAYHSRGWDYSELFDALGSSQAASLRMGQLPPAGQASQSTYFTGITEEQAFAGVTLSASTSWQTGQYVRFTAGGDVSYVQPHLVTGADPCAGPTPPSGACTASAASADARDAIDRPGSRFSVDDTAAVDLWVAGMVMF
jgi:hypothetical protein